MAGIEYSLPAVGPLWLKPDTETPCHGAGKYFVSGYASLGHGQFASTTIELGETFPLDGYDMPDYDGVINALDTHFSVDVGGGVYRYLTNAVTIVKHCFDRDHDDGFRSHQNERPSVEWVASLVMVDDPEDYFELNEVDMPMWLGRIGIWLPFAAEPLDGKPLNIVRSRAGGDGSDTYVALNDFREFVHLIRREPGSAAGIE